MIASIISASSGASAAATTVAIVVGLAVVAVYVVSLWRIYTKLGQAGWSGIVPFLNTYVVFRLRSREWWWVLLLAVPCVGIVVGIIYLNDLARLFGKGIGWTIGLVVVPVVMLPVLAFGGATAFESPERLV